LGCKKGGRTRAWIHLKYESLSVWDLARTASSASNNSCREWQASKYGVLANVACISATSHRAATSFQGHNSSKNSNSVNGQKAMWDNGPDSCVFYDLMTRN
jgi:hypothetical protein